jgi:hypothetical protein
MIETRSDEGDRHDHGCSVDPCPDLGGHVSGRVHLGSRLFTRPGIHRKIFAVETEDVPAIRLWAFGCGFYYLFIASGPSPGSSPGAAAAEPWA